MYPTNTRQLGSLKVLVHWEEFLRQIFAKTDDPTTPVGRLSIHEVPPRNPKHDARMTELFCVEDLGLCMLEIPKGTEVTNVEADKSPTGKAYDFLRLGDRSSGIAVHLHEGLLGDDGLVVSGRVHMCVRTWWPKGADTRQEGRQAFKNYVYYLDITPWDDADAKPTKRVVLMDPAAPMYSRAGALSFGDNKGQQIFATRSMDWNPHQERGINQHVEVREILEASERETAQTTSGPSERDLEKSAMAEAFSKVGLSVLPGGQTAEA